MASLAVGGTEVDTEVANIAGGCSASPQARPKVGCIEQNMSLALMRNDLDDIWDLRPLWPRNHFFTKLAAESVPTEFPCAWASDTGNFGLTTVMGGGLAVPS